jgi:hypothetical protein
MADTMTPVKLAISTASSGAPVLVTGVGGAGVDIATCFKATNIARRGNVGTNVRILGFDVEPHPPIVRIPSDNGEIPVQLIPEIEYLRLGRGCSPPALRAAARNGLMDGRLRELVERQPDGRLTRSLQTGSDGERLFGLIAYEWSRAEVRRLISSALMELNDVRRGAENDSAGASSPLVIVASSIAGGVGSAITLPLVADVKRELDRLGMDPGACTFVGVALLAETFPALQQRSSNALDTIEDFNHAQKQGVMPW